MCASRAWRHCIPKVGTRFPSEGHTGHNRRSLSEYMNSIRKNNRTGNACLVTVEVSQLLWGWPMKVHVWRASTVCRFGKTDRSGSAKQGLRPERRRLECPRGILKTRGQWPHRPASTRLVRNKLVMLFDFDYLTVTSLTQFPSNLAIIFNNCILPTFRRKKFLPV